MTVKSKPGKKNNSQPSNSTPNSNPTKEDSYAVTMLGNYYR
jgi:hypothetical protein